MTNPPEDPARLFQQAGWTAPAAWEPPAPESLRVPGVAIASLAGRGGMGAMAMAAMSPAGDEASQADPCCDHGKAMSAKDCAKACAVSCALSIAAPCEEPVVEDQHRPCRAIDRHGPHA